MSGLAALLAGRNEPGTYRWHNAAHVEDIQHAVEHAGWRFGYLDGWTIDDKSSFMKATAMALDLPDDRGDSFEALADCLAEVSAGDKGGVVLLWDGWSPFARADGDSFNAVLEAFSQRVNSDQGGKFAVLLRGEGPDIELPELLEAH